jgi:hypothetical protein
MAAALVVAGVCATASQRGYELANLPMTRAALSSTWDSLAIGAEDLWNDLGTDLLERPPPLPPKVPAGRPAPVTELPPEALGNPVKKPRVDRARAATPLTSLRAPQTAGVHSGAMSYE